MFFMFYFQSLKDSLFQLPLLASTSGDILEVFLVKHSLVCNQLGRFSFSSKTFKPEDKQKRLSPTGHIGQPDIVNNHNFVPCITFSKNFYFRYHKRQGYEPFYVANMRQPNCSKAINCTPQPMPQTLPSILETQQVSSRRKIPWGIPNDGLLTMDSPKDFCQRKS